MGLRMRKNMRIFVENAAWENRGRGGGDETVQALLKIGSRKTYFMSWPLRFGLQMSNKDTAVCPFILLAVPQKVEEKKFTAAGN